MMTHFSLRRRVPYDGGGHHDIEILNIEINRDLLPHFAIDDVEITANGAKYIYDHISKDDKVVLIVGK